MVTITLQNAFASLSDKTRDWLTSEEIVDKITSLNDGLGLKSDRRRIISKLILRVAVQDLDPRDFANELGSQLKINYEAAKEITQKVHDECLQPIEAELKKINVDVHEMIEYSTNPPEQLSAYPDKPAPVMEYSKPAKLGSKPLKVEATSKLLTTAPDNLPLAKQKMKPVSPAQPFVLHKETGDIKPVEEGGKTSFKYKESVRERAVKEPPVKVKIESPLSGNNLEFQRIVHYSNFFTPFNTPQTPPTKGEVKVKVPDSKWFS